MLKIEINLSTAFYLQTDGQMERKNQELEQYLRLYINHKQSNWSEQLATTEFAFNNKVHIATKSSLFKVNYERKLRIDFEIRKKEKNVKAEKFVKKIEMYEEIKAALRKLQEEMKRHADKNRKKAVEYKVEDRLLLSIRDLVWQIRNSKIKKIVRPYKIKKIILENIVKLKLPASIKIHPVVNVSRTVLYQEQVEQQKSYLFQQKQIEKRSIK